MNFFKNIFLVLGAIALMLTSCDDSDSDDAVTEIGDLEGTVLVTFGSSYTAPQETYDLLDNLMTTTYPDDTIRWGFTSDLILNILRNGTGECTKIIDNDSPEEAIKIMIEEEGYSKFYVQSLHVIPGEEYDELVEVTEEITAVYDGVDFSIGSPLLTTEDDYLAVAKVMAAQFEAQVAEGPVLFMGHGTPHAADSTYANMETALQAINENFYVGTVEGTSFEAGETSIGSIITRLKALEDQPTSVTITPLMSIAGDHANNDMNGTTGEEVVADQSWREQLEGAGYTVNCVMKGLGDYAEIRAIWLAHLKTAKEVNL